MVGKLTHVSVVVADYDEALAWYTEKLGLEPRMDSSFGEGTRFVTVAAPGQDVEIVLHKPFGGSDQQPGGNGGFVFSSDDCRRTRPKCSSEVSGSHRGRRMCPGASRPCSRTFTATLTSSFSPLV